MCVGLFGPERGEREEKEKAGAERETERREGGREGEKANKEEGRPNDDDMMKGCRESNPGRGAQASQVFGDQNTSERDACQRGRRDGANCISLTRTRCTW